MKIFKKLAILVMALTLCVGFGATVTACDKEGSNNSQKIKGYEFKVLNADGTAAIGYYVDLCEADGNQQCLGKFIAVEKDGSVFYPLDDTSIAYTVHVYNADRDEMSLKKGTQKNIPASYNGGILTLTLAE